jgi:hypothetical protein
MPLYPPEITPNILHLNPDLRSDKPSTSPLSNGTALKEVAQRQPLWKRKRAVLGLHVTGYSPPLGCHVLLCKQSKEVKCTHFQRSHTTSGTLYPIICSFLVYFLQLFLYVSFLIIFCEKANAASLARSCWSVSGQPFVCRGQRDHRFELPVTDIRDTTQLPLHVTTTSSL